MKSKHHNFWLSLNGSNYKRSEQVSIYIFYKYGNSSLKKKRIPNISVPFSLWDKKNKFIKQTAVDKKILSPVDIEYLDGIRGKFNAAARQMSEGLLTVDNAFRKILKQSEDDTVLNHLTSETPHLYTPNTFRKYKDYLRSIEKHTGTEFTPLRLSHLQDLDAVKQIATKVKNAVSPNSAIDYLKALDVVSDRAKLDVLKPFKSNKLLPSKDQTKEKQVTYIDLIEGINKIRTKQDYLSYSFWLFSLCLRGLDGTDIVNISEKNVQGSFKMPYYPDWDSDNCFINCGEKAYYLKRRGKTRKFYRILLNLYPTYYLHRLIKNLITETHPEYSYRGKDKLRIFNFLTKDEKGNPLDEGVKKWIAFRDTISKKQKRLLGEGIKTTRHTFTNLTKNELTLTDSEQQDLIQHSTDGKALSHYQSEQQITTDLNHIFALQEYKIASTVNLLFQFGDVQGYHSFKINEGAKTLMSRDKLTTFTQEDEREYQKLLRNFTSKPIPKINTDTGLIEFTFPEKPMRLVELEDKRKSDYRDVNPIGDVYLDAPEDEINYMLKKSEKEGIEDFNKTFEAIIEKKSKEYKKKQKVKITIK
tara:strand:- start:2534 stop:4288 length:1755 start_codon:yes stop_codon:yes gene_type:complete